MSVAGEKWHPGLKAMRAAVCRYWRRRALKRETVARRALAGHPALARPRVRAVLLAVSAEHGVPLWRIIGAHRDKRVDATHARRAVIARLYEAMPGPGYGAHVFHYGAAELGRLLGLHHTSVLKAARLAAGEARA